MENIESWSRTRRASAHSIPMSSESGSRSSSIGPSSFTENLTLYIRGERDHLKQFDRPALDSPQEGNDPAVKNRNQEAEDIEALHEELEATLRRHNELIADNRRLEDDLKRAISFQQMASEAAASNSVHDSMKERRNFACRQCQTDDELTSNEALMTNSKSLKLTETEEENRSLRCQLLNAQRSIEAANSQLQSAVDRSSAQSLRIQELESKTASQEELLQVSENKRLSSPEEGLYNRQQNEVDDLDNQSLIEELEDDLERTRQELDRVIKDKRRVERQLEFTSGDLKYERTRNEELESQISKIRASSQLKSSCYVGANHADSAEATGQEMELRGLKNALDKASLRIEILESKFSGTIEPRKVGVADDQHNLTNTIVTETHHTNEPDSFRTKVENYIRKMKMNEHDLKTDLRDTQAEVCRLRIQLLNAGDVERTSHDRVNQLEAEIARLQDVKNRMGRVLMYQWGKEEVGEIERSRGNGLNERGMGYRYLYFNKNGTSKTIE